MARRFWDRETARIALRIEARRLGHVPMQRDIRSAGHVCPSEPTLRKLFGSLSAALRAAGLCPNPRGRTPGWRKSKCVRGHARTRGNVDPSGHCRKCAAIWKANQGRPAVPTRPSSRYRSPEDIARYNANLAKYWGVAS